MAGICLCRYEDCSKKNNCKRYLTKADGMSSFAEFQNICNKSTNFQYFWEEDVDIVKKEN